MSERDSRDATSPELDEALSALLDGEGDAEALEALRARLEASPELGRRLAGLARVDEALRALPERAVPADLLARVKAEAERDDAGAPAGPPGLRPRAPRARRRWLVVGGALTAAAAAALALYLAPGLRPAPEAAPPPRTAQPAPSVPPPAPGPAPQREVARLPEAPRVAPAPGAPGGGPLEGVDDVSPEEILMAMELETLQDLEILELLEELES